ncbi:hypothetical protein JR316_0004476 [Psilocybe cubensis]|uniref:Uncharacterized protein n=2 Tax=Psilocybe cubensis TaxID=181762 RepID=A0ACB8H3D1_PSICU|nr:hypothetical protein JR316_0004476 [Psilocybe cubensis]KAH9482376.1 hypothetical protein JR316_0004476 [Psilocybe cubensis]
MKLPVLAAFLSVANAAELVLHHRVFHPDLPSQQYRKRSTVSLDTATAEHVPTFAQDLAAFADAVRTLDRDAEVLYQVALEHEGDSSEALWDYSSVKACYLSKATADTILLHLPSGQDNSPFAIDYFVSPIPHDGSCPQTKSKTSSPASSLKAFSNKVQRLNSTVLLRQPTTPPLPELRAPPPLTPEGQVVKPVPEKSFIQKYWMYIVAVVLVLAVGSGPEEPEQPKRGGGGGGGQ